MSLNFIIHLPKASAMAAGMLCLACLPSGSPDLEGALAGINIGFGVRVRSVQALLEEIAELVNLGQVLLLGPLGLPPHDEIVLLRAGQLLQEILLLEADLLEEVGISEVVPNDGGAVLHLVDLVLGQVTEANGVEQRLLMLPQRVFGDVTRHPRGRLAPPSAEVHLGIRIGLCWIVLDRVGLCHIVLDRVGLRLNLLKLVIEQRCAHGLWRGLSWRPHE